MIAAEVTTRPSKAEEHLQLLRSLALELQRAMDAIALDDLAGLEDSIVHQQELSDRLRHVAEEFRAASSPPRYSPSATSNGGLMGQIRTAAGELQRLNYRYSILLQHSSRSAALMASLFTSFQGQLQGDSGARSKVQTWACQI